MINNTILLENGGMLEIYLQDDGQLHDFILIFPGGGYTYCESREGEPIAISYLAEGFHAAVVTYMDETDQASFTWGHIYNRAEEALQLVLSHMKQWNINPDGIRAAGFSAGGHLALSLAARCSDDIHAIILGYPLILVSLCRLIHPSLPDVLTQLHKHLPPVFLFSTWEDHTVPVRNSLQLLQRLNEHGIPCEAHIYQWGHHGLSLAKEWSSNGDRRNIEDRAASWLPLSITWLRRITDTKGEQPLLPQNCLRNLWNLPNQRKQLLIRFPYLSDPQILEALGHLTVDELIKKSIESAHNL